MDSCEIKNLIMKADSSNCVLALTGLLILHTAYFFGSVKVVEYEVDSFRALRRLG